MIVFKCTVVISFEQLMVPKGMIINSLNFLNFFPFRKNIIKRNPKFILIVFSVFLPTNLSRSRDLFERLRLTVHVHVGYANLYK